MKRTCRIDPLFVRGLPEDHGLSMRMVGKLCELKIPLDWELLDESTRDFPYSI